MARRGASETLSKEIRDLLRADILAGRWAPGEKLHLASLSAHYGISSTVVREALTRLAGERLVQLRPNRGFFVPELSLDELRDFNELRCLSEEFGIALAIERGDLAWESEVLAAHHTLERTPRFDESEPGRPRGDWTIAHQAFHAKLIEACGVPVLIDLTATLADGTALYRRWAAAPHGVHHRDIEREHREILQAVIDRDGPRAGRLLREHYTRTMQYILEAGLAAPVSGGSGELPPEATR